MTKNLPFADDDIQFPVPGMIVLSEAAFGAATIAKAQLIFDVVALPSETPLIKAARAAGVKVITGAEVIALQAAEQFERYTGVRPTPAQIADASAISRA